MKKHSFAIKVCGITRQSDLSTAMGMGAHFCGFIFHPGSPRHIAPPRAAALDSALIRRVGVFVNQNAEEIMDIMKTARLEFAQLHGAHSLDCARRIGPEKVIRVLWPDRYESVDALQREMELWADSCAWFLLDAGTQGGGHGVSAASPGCQALVRFFALLRIKPHAPLLVRAPVNSFEF